MSRRFNRSKDGQLRTTILVKHRLTKDEFSYLESMRRSSTTDLSIEDFVSMLAKNAIDEFMLNEANCEGCCTEDEECR